MGTLTTSDWLAIMAILIATISAFLTYRASRLQLETMLITLLLDKAKEANAHAPGFFRTANDTARFQFAFAAIVQGIQANTLFHDEHRFLLGKNASKKLRRTYYLQLSPDLQNLIFDDAVLTERVLRLKNGEEKQIVESHIEEIRDFLQEAHTYYKR